MTRAARRAGHLIDTEAPDGTQLAMPCVTVIWMVNGLVSGYRVHMDISPAPA